MPGMGWRGSSRLGTLEAGRPTPLEFRLCRGCTGGRAFAPPPNRAIFSETADNRRVLPHRGRPDPISRGNQDDAELPVYLCDEGPEQGLSGRARGLEGCLAEFPAGGEDRGARAERGREIDAAANHG